MKCKFRNQNPEDIKVEASSIEQLKAKAKPFPEAAEDVNVVDDEIIDDYNETVKKAVDNEIIGTLNDEVKKAAKEAIEEQRKAIRQILEEQKAILWQIVEEERKGIPGKTAEIRNSIIRYGI